MAPHTLSLSFSLFSTQQSVPQSQYYLAIINFFPFIQTPKIKKEKAKANHNYLQQHFTSRVSHIHTPSLDT
ncbi:hypothetical protein VNO77_21164 [Canavalia gladiata]|uniref:Uncharacterized protein n=1 Tax=Canavalia gladiata TaxID=3824 RepID=A0AAN9QN52_CANGL